MNYFNYFSEIEETFIRRRGRNLLLSPLDWALIEDWQEREIPLPIVLRAIESVFDGVDNQPTAQKKRTIKSLTYCREEIEAQYANWLAAQVGNNQAQSSKLKAQSSNAKIQNSASKESDLPKSDLFSGEVISAHLEKISIELEEARPKANIELRGVLEKISLDLAQLKRNPQTDESLEKSLEKLDAEIDEVLLKTAQNEKLKAEIEKQITSYKNKMEREVYERTFNLMFLKRLREQAEIPRLSLFYL